MISTAFPPHSLREYAFVADGERGAVIGPRGDIVWMCAPQWHSDAVFSALVGGPGVYAVTPDDPWFVWGGYYEEGSLIWRSRWVTSTGIIECREALARPSGPSVAVILRQIRAVDGPAVVQVRLDVRAGFGRSSMRDVERTDGIWTGRSGPLRFRWTGAAGARPGPDGLSDRIEVTPGGHHDLVFEVSSAGLTGPPVDAAAAWRETEAGWAGAVPPLPDAVGRRDARHAYAVLRGLTGHDGGMVAAATMGLPERAEVGRNYDYRYAWIRDQCLTGQAVASHGPHPLLDDAVHFVSERLLADGPTLKPAYRVDGGPVPDERPLSHLPGYPGGHPKVGNWVNRQFQLDTFGEALLLFAAAGRHDRLDADHWKAVEAAAAAIEARWSDPDAGIWEVDDDRWAHSRLTCVAGLRAAAALAPATQAGPWAALADRIAADAGSDCVHPSGRWQRSPTDGRVDAALLLPGIRGATPPDDPRHVATLDAVIAELSDDGYVYRYRHDARPLGDAEGAFVLCGFLVALAAHQQGRTAAARSWFERNRAACGTPGLLTEEFDVGERQLRGNFPQAFAHALLLECAGRLERSDADSCG